MNQDDWRLSKSEIEAKYPRGCPDYPSHCFRCGCTYCQTFWLEWRTGHAAYAMGVNDECAAVVRHLRSSDWFRIGVDGVIASVEGGEHRR